MSWFLTCDVEPVGGVCPTGASVWTPLDTVALNLFDAQALGIDPATILYVYTWGAGAVLSLWALGYAIGAAKAVIKKA